jgi:SAM-dependent methyltransferase
MNTFAIENKNHIFHDMKLEEVYSDQARHFHHTRKKHRPEMDSFLSIVKNLSKNCKRFDLGCGSGRVFPWLQEQRVDIQYTGVDTAQGFILLAQDLYPTANFVQDDMTNYLQKQAQQSIDCISAIASVQHLDSKQKRQDFFHASYRALEYNGYMIMTNWAYSKWFLQKYRRQMFVSLWLYSISLGKHQWNDISIPRKDPQRKENGKIFERYYHIFLLDELKEHAIKAGFSIEKLIYMGQDGQETDNRRLARNTIMICKKSI